MTRSGGRSGPAGAVRADVGFDYRKNHVTLTSNSDPAQVIDYTGIRGQPTPPPSKWSLSNFGALDGTNTVKEAFVEVDVPLLKDLSFAKSLDFTGAYRYADYSQSGVISRGAISPHVRERLFRRFVTTRADKGGTGLGLAIVRAVTEAHCGHVELLNSGPPEVVFHVSLPPARRSAARQLLETVQEARQELTPAHKIDQ